MTIKDDTLPMSMGRRWKGGEGACQASDPKLKAGRGGATFVRSTTGNFILSAAQDDFVTAAIFNVPSHRSFGISVRARTM